MSPWLNTSTFVTLFTHAHFHKKLSVCRPADVCILELGLYPCNDCVHFHRLLLCYPVMLSHFSPAPVKQIARYESNKPIKSKLTYRQSINRKFHNKSLRLIDWFNPPSEKLPHGDDFRVGPESDRTPRDNTVVCEMPSSKESNRAVFSRWFKALSTAEWNSIPTSNLKIQQKRQCWIRNTRKTCYKSEVKKEPRSFAF